MSNLYNNRNSEGQVYLAFGLHVTSQESSIINIDVSNFWLLCGLQLCCISILRTFGLKTAFCFKRILQV